MGFLIFKFGKKGRNVFRLTKRQPLRTICEYIRIIAIVVATVSGVLGIFNYGSQEAAEAHPLVQKFDEARGRDQFIGRRSSILYV